MSWPSRLADDAALPPTLPFGEPWPRISIVTPSLNQGRFIEETILSVLNQGYPNVEHIVIDGGSQDSTPAILDRYRDRLTYVASEPDRGQSHAINKGMARATGKIVTWLNSDDRLAPKALAGVALAFQTSGADMVAGICELMRDGHVVERHLTSCQEGVLPLDDLLDLDGAWNAGQFFFQPEVFFTRDLWNRTGGRVNEGLYYSMDYDLWLRFAATRARLKVIGRPVAQFRLHPTQKTADPALFKAELPAARLQFLRAHGLPDIEHPPTAIPDSAARIVFVNDLGVQFGAGIAQGRLAAAAALAGHDVTLVHATNEIGQSQPSTESQALLLASIERAKPDVVVVGNLHAAALPATFLGAIAERWPAAFVVHDLWLVTGRCAYTGPCDKFLSRCDESCPTADEYPALAPALIGPAWDAKRRLVSSDRQPLLLTNSDWTRTQIARALGASLNADVAHPIVLGVPDDFVPLDKRECRRLLGLPQSAFLVLLSAAALADPRKGRAQLLEALQSLDLADLELVFVGTGQRVEVPGVPVHHFMYRNDKVLTMIYSAADVFVGPSLEECLGQVFLEAAACGVPSVGFPVGGVPEALKHGVTGLLAVELTANALAAVLRTIHDDLALRSSLSVWARLWSENERTLECSYHRLHVVLRGFLLQGRVAFGRKIGFRPALAPDQEHESDVWQALTGFGPWEGPYPELNLGRCRWQEQLSGSFHVLARSNGTRAVRLRLRNLAPDQRLRICCGDAEVFNGPIAATSDRQETVVPLVVPLEAPRTLVTFEASASWRAPDGRALAVLLCGVEVDSTPAPTRASGKRRLSGWLSSVALRAFRLLSPID